MRAEWDINDQLTAWAAGGMSRGKEDNSLTTPKLLNAAGDASTGRFDNKRDAHDDGARFTTGAIKQSSL